MPPVSSPVNETYLHGLLVDYSILEISTMYAGSVNNITAGQPVTVDCSNGADRGKIVRVNGNVRVLGLAKSHKNEYIDETFAYTGLEFAGKMAVQSKGIVTVRPSYFLINDRETATVPCWDGSITAGLNPQTPLFSTSDGLISANEMSNTFIGYVIRPPTAMDFSLQILLEC